MTRRVPAEVFPPGDFIREELEARNWTQADLAAILKRPLPAVNEIIKGKKSITADTAKALGDAFGTGPEFWQNLQNAYDLAMTGPSDDDVARMAAIYAVAPVNDLVKRQWINWSNDAEELERSILKFYRAPSIAEINFPLMAARKSSSYDEMTPLEIAWCHRARQLAECVGVSRFKASALKGAFAELQRLTNSEQEVRHVPKLLADIGIRFVVVERLPKTKIDGAAFWLDSNSPAIAISLRHDRIDGFWFTLWHEIAHIFHNDRVTPLDTKLVGQDRQPTNEKSEIEKAADQFAESSLVPQADLESFIVRVKPLYSKVKINQFAGRIGIHPGIIVGQLQHRREIGFSHSREMLVAVRDLLTPSAMTDGWGSVPI